MGRGEIREDGHLAGLQGQAELSTLSAGDVTCSGVGGDERDGLVTWPGQLQKRVEEQVCARAVPCARAQHNRKDHTPATEAIQQISPAKGKSTRWFPFPHLLVVKDAFHW